MGTHDSVKRRYFRSCRDVDVYSRYAPKPKPKSGVAQDDGPAAVPSNDDVTVFGTKISPRGPGDARYLVACTSKGEVVVWSLAAGSPSSREPVARWRTRQGATAVGGDTLYDLQFMRNGGESQLVASGNQGVLVYRWSEVVDWIESERDGGPAGDGAAPSGRKRCQDPPARRPEPAATFQPSPHRPTNFNSATSSGDGTLYAAAGDGSCCYRFDLASETLLGTFGGRDDGGGGGGRGPANFLHVVKALPEDAAGVSNCILTGGEGGNVGFWDGKERRLVEMVHVQSAMNEKRGLVTSDLPLPTSSRSFLSSAVPASMWGSATRSWVSSADANGNWLAVCGGGESAPGGSGGGLGLSSSSRASGPGRCGFASLFHLPTRTFASGRVTRECVSSVVYSEGLGNFVTGGNEARLSFWGGTSFSSRVGRSWTSLPATYALTADGPSGLVVGGIGNVIDGLAGKSRVSSFTL